MLIALVIGLRFLVHRGQLLDEPQCPAVLVDRATLKLLADAPTPPKLEVAFRALVAPDGLEKLVFASRMATLQPSQRADLLLIDAIPRTKLEFNLLYTLSDPDSAASPTLAEIGGGSWLFQVLDAVLRQKRGVREFLMLAYVGEDNAELGELFPDMFGKIRAKVPELFQRANNSLPPSVRSAVDDSLAELGRE